jgi:hypothetical protein
MELDSKIPLEQSLYEYLVKCSQYVTYWFLNQMVQGTLLVHWLTFT